MSKKDKNLLIFFIKAPWLGNVKTRLQPELTPEQLVMIYRAMVEDTVSQFGDVGFCDVIIFCYPADSSYEMKNWLGNRFEYFPQHGNDLGERMHNAIAEMLNQKYNKVLLTGSDIPTLDATIIMKALSSLDDHDLVLGPSLDGGYYLIGMKQPHPELFQGITWSTNHVFEQTMQKAREAKLEIMQIESKSDIDTYRELEQLWCYLKRQNMKDNYSSRSKMYEAMKKVFDRQYALNGK